MTESEIVRQLQAEGYGQVFVWEDASGARYPHHSHPGQTAHVVLAGAITIATATGSRTYRAGDRFDVPAGESHAAEVGPEGCRYVVAE
ncbi:cupin domain-containing protein [Magnetospira sp. QH-2]|uniref:cupin domain-containing protein n=1 Tax=Magnetospira sp. (strain QH-2) TaxID=1288970 RepID=UPI0003E80C2B|nr:cupin domain-containing protein [Magnetospira sp. QH-2]CCQ73606.1 Conserved protein of unknown function [Magnetospira sp. QH-2]